MTTPATTESTVQPHAEWALGEIERRRRAAYADPITGSDLHFAEASRLEAMGAAESATLARQRGIARYQEIQAENPYPTEG